MDEQTELVKHYHALRTMRAINTSQQSQMYINLHSTYLLTSNYYSQVQTIAKASEDIKKACHQRKMKNSVRHSVLPYYTLLNSLPNFSCFCSIMYKYNAGTKIIILSGLAGVPTKISRDYSDY